VLESHKGRVVIISMAEVLPSRADIAGGNGCANLSPVLSDFAPAENAWAWRYIRAKQLLWCAPDQINTTLKALAAEEQHRHMQPMQLHCIGGQSAASAPTSPTQIHGSFKAYPAAAPLQKNQLLDQLQAKAVQRELPERATSCLKDGPSQCSQSSLAFAAPMVLVLLRAIRRVEQAALARWVQQVRATRPPLLRMVSDEQDPGEADKGSLRRTTSSSSPTQHRRKARSQKTQASEAGIGRSSKHPSRGRTRSHRAARETQRRWIAAFARQCFLSWRLAAEKGQSRRAVRMFCDGYKARALLAKALTALREHSQEQLGKRQWSKRHAPPVLSRWRRQARDSAKRRAAVAQALEQVMESRWLQKVSFAVESWRALARRRVLRKRAEDLLRTLVCNTLLRRHYDVWRQLMLRQSSGRGQALQRAQMHDVKLLQSTVARWQRQLVVDKRLRACNHRRLSSVRAKAFACWIHWQRRMQKAADASIASCQHRRKHVLHAWRSRLEASLLAARGLARRMLGQWRHAVGLLRLEAQVLGGHIDRLLILAWRVWVQRLTSFEHACSFARHRLEKLQLQAFNSWVSLRSRKHRLLAASEDCKQRRERKALQLWRIASRGAALEQLSAKNRARVLQSLALQRWLLWHSLWSQAINDQHEFVKKNYERQLASRAMEALKGRVVAQHKAEDVSARQTCQLTAQAWKYWLSAVALARRRNSAEAACLKRQRLVHFRHWRNLITASNLQQERGAQTLRATFAAWKAHAQEKEDWHQRRAALWASSWRSRRLRRLSQGWRRWSAHVGEARYRHHKLESHSDYLQHWNVWASERRWQRMRHALTAPLVAEMTLSNALRTWHSITSRRRGGQSPAAQLIAKRRRVQQRAALLRWRLETEEARKAAAEDARIDAIVQEAAATRPWVARAVVTRSFMLHTAFAGWALQSDRTPEERDHQGQSLEETWLSEGLSTLPSLSPEIVDHHDGDTISWSFAEASTGLGTSAASGSVLPAAVPAKAAKSQADLQWERPCTQCSLARKWQRMSAKSLSVKAKVIPSLQLAVSLWQGHQLRAKASSLRWWLLSRTLPALRQVQKRRLCRFFAAWLFGAGLARPWLLELLDAKAWKRSKGLVAKKPKRKRPAAKVEFDEDLACFAAWSHAVERVMASVLSQPEDDHSSQVPLIPSPFEVEVQLRILRAWRKLASGRNIKQQQQLQKDPVCTARYVYKPSVSYLPPQQGRNGQMPVPPTVARSIEGSSSATLSNTAHRAYVNTY